MNFPDKDFDRFDPSRWTQQYLSELPRFSYLPFAAFFHPPQYTDNAVNLTALITKELMKELRIYFYAKKEPAFSNTDILRPKENFLARIEKRKAR
jgi:hypothetical protein